MIRGYFEGPRGRRRPYVTARVETAATGRAKEVDFLIDTGADRSLLSLSDAVGLGLDAGSLPTHQSIGIGGSVAMGLIEAVLVFGEREIGAMVRVLVPGGPEQETMRQRIPSVLGRDVLAHFGLYIEERRDLVLLLEPQDADALGASVME
jgi:predicted aspartyl protease